MTIHELYKLILEKEGGDVAKLSKMISLLKESDMLSKGLIFSISWRCFGEGNINDSGIPYANFKNWPSCVKYLHFFRNF
jgi:hypothetical protein